MKVILITGFLGSGKTTLAVELARIFADREVRTGLVINEVGDVGIDGDVLLAEGKTQLFELLSGCVCCQVGSDLVETLRTLDGDGSVEWAVIEPSGVAYASQIVDTISYWSDEAQVVQVALVDGPRLEVLLDHLDNLIRDALDLADVVVMSKADLMQPEEIAAVRSRIDELAPGRQVIVADLLHNASQVAAEVFSHNVSP